MLNIFENEEIFYPPTLTTNLLETTEKGYLMNEVHKHTDLPIPEELKRTAEGDAKAKEAAKVVQVEADLNKEVLAV